MRTNYYQRQEIYSRIFDFLLNQQVPGVLPAQLEQICYSFGIELKPLSEVIIDTGFTEKQIFEIWGNENGHLMPYLKKDGTYKFKIAYNDGFNHKDRKKFTIAEELTHIILGHYSDEMYNIFNPTPWNEDLYQFHERCARIGAGLIVCPPPVFYEVNGFLNIENIRYFCDISEPCANTRYDILTKHRGEIENHPKYKIEFPRKRKTPVNQRVGDVR